MVSEVNNSLTGTQPARSKSVQSPQQNTAGTTARAGDNSASSATAEDSVILTEAATRLQRLGAIIAETPQVDQQRVEQLRQSIADSSYQIDDQRVADRFLAFEGAVAGSNGSSD